VWHQVLLCVRSAASSARLVHRHETVGTEKILRRRIARLLCQEHQKREKKNGFCCFVVDMFFFLISVRNAKLSSTRTRDVSTCAASSARIPSAGFVWEVSYLLFVLVMWI
jgi:hypothetical protein